MSTTTFRLSNELNARIELASKVRAYMARIVDRLRHKVCNAAARGRALIATTEARFTHSHEQVNLLPSAALSSYWYVGCSRTTCAPLLMGKRVGSVR